MNNGRMNAGTTARAVLRIRNIRHPRARLHYMRGKGVVCRRFYRARARRSVGRASCVAGTWSLSRNADACADLRAIRKAGSLDRSRWSSSSCRTLRSSCGTRIDDSPTQLWWVRRGHRPNNSSARSRNQSISLVAISTLTFLEESSQPFAKLQASPQ